MKLTCQQTQDNLAVFALAGEMTGDDGDRLHASVSEHMQGRLRDLVLDCDQLESVDSRALEALLSVQQQCQDALGQLRLVAVGDNLNQILNMTRLSGRFTRCQSVEQAIESLR